MLRLGIALFFTMNVIMFTLTLWTEDVYGGTRFMDQQQAAVLHSVIRYICLLSTLPVLYLLGIPLAENVIAQSRALARSSDLLLLVGVAAAFIYSCWSVVHGQGHIYFEVCCVVLLAVTLGRWFEATGKLKTTAALRSLERLVPDEVRVCIDGDERTVPAISIRPGDDVVVRAGERVPVDGTVIRGCAAVDQQLITGESEPILAAEGARVFAGSLNLDGILHVRVGALPGESALDRLIAAVLQAAGTRERYGRLADRVAAVFLPLVLVTAAATVGYWVSRGAPATGILRGLAVVVIACPCALALATPMAIWSCFGRAARSGLIIRQADVLERLNRVDRVGLDKTGTLTTGCATLSDWVVSQKAMLDTAEDPRRVVARFAIALANCTQHPVAEAVARGLTADTRFGSANKADQLSGVVVAAGRGVMGRWPRDDSSQSAMVGLLGNLTWMNQHDQQIPGDLAPAIASAGDQGRSYTLVAWGGAVRAVFVLSEQLRPAAPGMLEFFCRRGMTVRLLTGDHRQRAERIARQLGLEAEGDLLPATKADRVRAWRAAGHRVMMIGDGVNDAPALAAADISLAMGCGADLSRQTADICLLSNDLSRLSLLFELAEQTVHTIRWNLVWSLAYNALAIPLAVIGWVNPMVASIAMVVSSLMVVGNSLRLSEESAGDASRGNGEWLPRGINRAETAHLTDVTEPSDHWEYQSVSD
jgi:heavy metal translocating P-type ATPase